MNFKILSITAVFLLLLVGAFFLFKPFKQTSLEEQTINEEQQRGIPLGVIDVLTGETIKEVTFQNLKYKNNYLEVIFDDAIEPPILDFYLKSHPSVDYVLPVGKGKQVTMYYDINSTYKLKNALGEPEFIDMRTGQRINRSWKFVYWGNESYEEPIYSCVKKLTINGTLTDECIQTGTQIKTRENWIPYNSSDIPEGKIRMGIEVEVLPDDWVDGKWVVGGIKINKHALWQQVFYYDFSYNVFLDSDWTRSAGSPRVEVNSGHLRIGGEGTNDDWANHTINPIDTSKNFKINISTRERIDPTGGGGYYLATVRFRGSSGSSLSAIASLGCSTSDGPTSYGWFILDQWSGGCNGQKHPATAGLYVKYQSIIEGNTTHFKGYLWVDVNDNGTFINVYNATALIGSFGNITAIGFSQPWDKESQWDWVRMDIGISGLGINLLSPSNNSNISTNNVNFSARVSPDSNISINNVSLYIDGIINQTITTNEPTSSMISSFGITTIDPVKMTNGIVGDNGWHTDTSTPGAYIKVDLGANNEKDFRMARFYRQSLGGIPNYTIQYSDDGSSWQNATQDFTPPDIVGWYQKEWEGVGSHRYWRLLLVNTPGSGPWYDELEFYTIIYNFSKNLSEGKHNWTVKAYGSDNVQYNASEGTWVFTVDTIPPQITFKLFKSR